MADDDPLDQARQLIAKSRHEFARDVDALLHEVRVFSASFGDAIGEVSRDQALRALRTVVLEKFDERLPMRSSADPVLRQLVREMVEYWDSPDRAVIDIDDWLKEARKAVD